MAAPAHNPAQNPNGAIRLRPEIVIDPNYRVVQPNIAQPNVTPNPPPAAPTSFEDAQQRAFDQGRQFERNGGERMAEAKKDGGHDHWHPPGWLNTLILVVVFGAIGLIVLNWFVNNMDRTVNPQGFLARQQQERIDALTAENDRLRGSGGAVNRGGGVTAGSARGNAGGVYGRPPSPDDVLAQQRAAGNVTRTRIPCADGWTTLPNGNCGRWVPN